MEERKFSSELGRKARVPKGCPFLKEDWKRGPPAQESMKKQMISLGTWVGGKKKSPVRN